MIRHIVFFKHSDAAKIKELSDMLNALEEKIDFILDLEVGMDLLHSARSFDLALTITLPDIKHLNLYAEHAEHIPVVEWVKANGFETKVVDYEL
jgi:hypothetical protein